MILFDKDDITSTLPDGVTDDDESKDDFLGNEVIAASLMLPTRCSRTP